MTIYSTTFFAFFSFFVTFFLGITMGSFLNCVAMRVLSGEPIARGRSHCMSCGHKLGALDLVPLFSWLLLRGKCRYCESKISARYPLSELVLGIVYVLVLAKYDLTLRTLELIVLCSILLCVTLCDLDEHIIPDRFIIIGMINRIIFVLISGNILEELKLSLIGAFSVSLPLLILSLILDKILKKDTMGGGDIKLFSYQANIIERIDNDFERNCVVGYCVSLDFSYIGNIITYQTDDSRSVNEFSFFLKHVIVGISYVFGLNIIIVHKGIIELIKLTLSFRNLLIQRIQL
jgi:leader peptidase (prepilin peptidase)/N-methyltransferase